MKHLITHPKTFRYFTKGNKDEADYLFYVLHGYGQLAEFFIQKFNFLSSNYYVVAPEGMHRFYLNGTSGRVGASWMTKEERETDISDNISWLNELDKQIQLEKQFKKVILLGFSQGGPTAIRWMIDKKLKLDSLIIWASVFPPDLNLNTETGDSPFGLFSTFVIGNKDENFNNEEQTNLLEFYHQKGFTNKSFDGNHTINQAVLEEILNKLNRS